MSVGLNRKLSDGLIESIAFPKINLFLNVLGESSGYLGKHELRTLMLKLDDETGSSLCSHREGKWYDEISVEDAYDWSCETISTIKYADEIKLGDNLMVRAGKCLASVAERDGKISSAISYAARMMLLKRVPIAAGMGGGSANAALVLRALNSLWSLHYSHEELASIGASIGADIPFFVIDDKCALATGIGDVLHPITLGMKLHVLLVNIGRPLMTEEVFREFTRGHRSSCSTVTSITFMGHAADNARPSILHNIYHGSNDLETAALRILPEVGRVLNALIGKRGCILSRLSGSGPTCFGLFDTPENLSAAYGTMLQEYQDYWLAALNIKV